MNKASYWSQDVYKMLDIGASTLRRWAAELEKKGWQFDKDENKRRRYYERDVIAFRSIKEMNERQGMTIEEAINRITGEHNISSQVEPNMLIERPNDVAQLALSIQTDIKELQEVYAKGYLDLKQENSELKGEVAALREEFRQYIAATQEPKQEPGWIARILRKFK